MSADALSHPPDASLEPHASDGSTVALAEGRYRALMRATADIVWTATPEGVASSGMPEWRAFTGQTLDQVAEFGSFDAIHPEDRANSMRVWLESIATGANHESEERLRRHDGVYRLMRVRAVPVRDNAGNIVEWVGMHTDITEQRALEDSLRQRERDLKEAYRLANLGSWWWDVEANTVTWTEEVYRVFEVDPSQPAPNFEALEPYHFPETWKQLQGAVARLLETGEPYAIDNELRMKDGRSKWIAARGEVEARKNGKVSRVRGTIQDITERKHAEQSLRASEGRFRRLFESDLMGVCIPDRFGAFYEGNDEFLRTVGYTRADLEAGLVRWDTMTPPEYAALDAAHIAEAAERGSCTPYEKEYIRKDGTRVPIFCGYALLEGSEDVYVGFIQDLSVQKDAENALRKSEATYRTIGEALDYGVWVCDAEGRNTYASQSFLQMLGITQEQCSQFGWGNALHPEELERTIAAWKECVRTAGDWDIEHRFLGADGEWHAVLARGCPVLDDKGSVTGWAGINLDISRLKQAEAKLKEREQRFSLLAESLPQLIFIADPLGSNIYCNQRLLRYAGTTPGGDPNIRWENLIHPDDLRVAAQKWVHCRETGEPYLDEHRLRRHDGVYRWFLARAVPLRNDQGEIERWLGSSTDIHDQKQAEEALRRSEKLAATGRLAASVAHEINNPLSSVTNAVYLALQDTTLNETTRGWLRLADEELVRVAHVTTQTLRFFRQTTAPTWVSVSQVMDAVLEIFASRFRSFSIQVERDYRDREKLYCFSGELRQVFANLIGNALDAMAQGGRFRIRIASGRAWAGSERRGVSVTVADSGSGIPAKLRKHVFEPFISTKADTGTGLGLWVSEGIVRKHQGGIALRSSTGTHRHGTVFSLFLPFDGIPQGEFRSDAPASLASGPAAD